jgi:hypothetical protein
MFKPPPLDEHWTIIPLSEPESGMPARPIIDPEEDQIAGLGTDASVDPRHRASLWVTFTNSLAQPSQLYLVAAFGHSADLEEAKLMPKERSSG